MSIHIDVEILNKLNDHFLRDIRIIHVFGYKVTEVLIVTKDDKCYAFGENGCEVLGFGHDRQVKEPKIIEELCDKRIMKFLNGINHFIALTKDGKLLMWGLNVATMIEK